MNPDLLLNLGHIYTNAVATEWAVVSKPTLQNVLGSVIKSSSEHDSFRRGLCFSGRVHDQENGVDAEFFDEMLPKQVKAAPTLKQAVVLTWAEITEPHSIYQRNGLPHLLPEYAPRYLHIGSNKQETYWLIQVSNSYPKY